MIQRIVTLLMLATLSACDIIYFDNPDYGYIDVMIYWSQPTERASGEAIDPNTEIAGYEIRYKDKNDEDYSYLLIADATQHQALLTRIKKQGKYTFEVAAIDQYGIYSSYVTAVERE